MPFDLLSDQVYETLIKPALEQSGYDARRADTTNNMGLIMRDVVEGIQNADLVVADLSGRNPNVFWELGLAHGLRKQAILLARSAGDIPFDLGGYRAIIYPLRLLEPVALDDALAQELSGRLNAITEGGVRFGDPLADFGRPATPEMAEDDGLLDQVLGLKTDSPRIGEYIGAMVSLLTGLSEEMTAASASIPAAEPGNELDRARDTFVAYAPIWERYATEFEAYIASTLLPMTLRAQRGFAAIVKLGQLGDSSSDGGKALAANLRAISEPAREYAAMFLSTAAATRQSAQLTASLRQPGERLAVALERVAGLFEQLSRLSVDVESMT